MGYSMSIDMEKYATRMLTVWSQRKEQSSCILDMQIESGNTRAVMAREKLDKSYDDLAKLVQLIRVYHRGLISLKTLNLHAHAMDTVEAIDEEALSVLR